MKFFHLSDLHLGKRVYDFSMIEDQKYILEQILVRAEEEKIDGVFISGDVYDKGVPPVEAVRLLDCFLTELSKKGIWVFMIAGNHDSAQRLDFGSQLFQENCIHICGTYDGTLKRVLMKDSFGEIEVFLLPFIKPSLVSQYFEEEISSYEKAVEVVLQSAQKEQSRRNILLAHQFVTWRGEAERSDSETYSLGGVDAVDAGVFSDFDYVALGHLHSPQKIGREEIRYAGSPLAYSFSEIRRKKSITLLEFKEKGNIKIELLPLIPIRPLREIMGPLQGLLEVAKAQGGSEDYIRAVLTDQSTLNDPLGQLRIVYPNLMTIELAGQERQERALLFSAEDTSPKELFNMFFQWQTDREMNAAQRKITEKIWGAIGGDGD